ncbi:N-acetylmuramoyl-L-alanine amidase [Fictibacillus sp. Mic-4]|uniref:N-acetylmuramoyl-L-alanine amidase n=1 Tax=Fictibacillus sp. Mic-4 TaxID=3132826 RepID=UPI003CFAF8D4
MPKIFIDPGHGGKDSGAIGNGLQEKDLTLDIALRMRRILLDEYEGVVVKLSRATDIYVSLDQRTNMANAWGADFFVAVHINYGGGTGYEDYIHNSLPDSSKTAVYRSQMHAEIIKATDWFDRGMKKADFHVLRESQMPAFLSENGFIDNAEDAAKLKTGAFREKIARGHVNGLAAALDLKKKVTLYRVVVDGVQVGAYSEKRSILNAIDEHLNQADHIIIEKV